MVLTVSFVLSPVIGLSCHRRLADTSAKLDAGVEASGPHDFTVRKKRFRQQRNPRPSHPQPYVRDDRETPLCVGPGCERYGCDLGRKRRGIFFAPGLDDPNRLDPARQIRRCAQVRLGPVPGCTRDRHCEKPTGRANARPMTGSATKQFTLRHVQKWIASLRRA
jgi:hypothetical protein